MEQITYSGTVQCDHETCSYPAVGWSPKMKRYYCQDHSMYSMIAGYGYEKLPDPPECLKILMGTLPKREGIEDGISGTLE